MDKIKAFFQNKIVKIVCWVILALDVVGLILGGVSVAEIGKGVELTAYLVQEQEEGLVERGRGLW